MKLQKHPVGLLKLLSLLVDGRAPTGFADEVRPVVDATEFYGSNLLGSFTSVPSVTAINVGTDAVHTIVTGPIRLYALGVELIMGAAAGTSVNFALRIRIPGVSSPGVSIGGINLPTYVAGQSLNYGVLLPKPMVLSPGCQLIASITGNAGGADHTSTVRWIAEQLTPDA